MKRLEFKIYLFMMLITLSLISVGFASWVMNDVKPTHSTGSFYVDDVTNSNQYINCSSTINKFDFFKTGFVNNDNEIVNNGNISFDLTIDMSNCKSLYNLTDTTKEYILELEICMNQENLQLFNSNDNMLLTCVIKQGDNVLSSSTEFDYIGAKTKLTIPYSTNDVILNVSYEFVILNNTYFKETIYPILIKDNFNFNLSAKLSGKEVTE